MRWEHLWCSPAGLCFGAHAQHQVTGAYFVCAAVFGEWNLKEQTGSCIISQSLSEILRPEPDLESEPEPDPEPDHKLEPE